MDINKKISDAMVRAAKEKDKDTLSALRMIKSALHNREIDLKDQFGEKEILQVLSSMVKQRKDSVEQYRNGGRPELAEKEEREIEIIRGFMPEQMSDEEIGAQIDQAIEEAGATSIRDMGKVMKLLMPKLTGKADGKAVGEAVKAKLS
ncbi:MAG TPA: GatB/YqeY domain-containing protein [Syntrophales bacterium]|nr:GatB/YqeY domain-containing protein [Syntrophales bacterium]HPQ43160.1 GatB/YqeY domain-containing protein [Syntrophales bacterium]